jgi:hypothetical protein
MLRHAKGIELSQAVSAVALDHPDGRAHDLRQLEDGDASGERVRGEGVAEVVGRRRRLNARCLDCRCPDSAAEVVEVQRTTLGCRERRVASSRAGWSSNAASARRVSGTSRIEFFVFPPGTMVASTFFCSTRTIRRVRST